MYFWSSMSSDCLTSSSCQSPARSAIQPGDAVGLLAAFLHLARAPARRGRGADPLTQPLQRCVPERSTVNTVNP